VRLAATAVMTGVLGLAASACGSSTSSVGGKPADAGPVQHPASLVGEVGKNNAFTIQLSDDKGAPITHLAAGTYKLVVHDDSGIHNFHLRGTGVDDITSVPDQGVKTFTVTFKPGTYTFVCDPHASQMRGDFIVS
jgi:plastocyanin